MGAHRTRPRSHQTLPEEPFRKQRIAEAFQLGNVEGLALELTPDYNVAPQTMQPDIVWDEAFGTRTLHMMFWRFLPRYVTDPKQFKLSTINAKGETLL